VVCCAVSCCVMQVVEDVTEGSVVTGLSTRVAKNAEELRGMYNSGRANRDTQVSAGTLLPLSHTRCQLWGRCTKASPAYWLTASRAASHNCICLNIARPSVREVALLAASTLCHAVSCCAVLCHAVSCCGPV
jgi:hypothetical protein